MCLHLDGKHRDICKFLWSVRSTTHEPLPDSRSFRGTKHGSSVVVSSAARQRGSFISHRFIRRLDFVKRRSEKPIATELSLCSLCLVRLVFQKRSYLEVWCHWCMIGSKTRTITLQDKFMVICNNKSWDAEYPKLTQLRQWLLSRLNRKSYA